MHSATSSSRFLSSTKQKGHSKNLDTNRFQRLFCSPQDFITPSFSGCKHTAAQSDGEMALLCTSVLLPSASMLVVFPRTPATEINFESQAVHPLHVSDAKKVTTLGVSSMRRQSQEMQISLRKLKLSMYCSGSLFTRLAMACARGSGLKLSSCSHADQLSACAWR